MARPVGIIGGSGFYKMDGLVIEDEVIVDTPFGRPSDAVMIGNLDGRSIAFLPRHGRGHRILPNELNFRANIFAFKTLGIEEIVSISAVGSMKEDLVPGDLVIVDQFVDRTKSRIDTFFGEGLVAHVSFAHPTCDRLRKSIVSAAQSIGVKAHDGGTYICIEGPMFSSRAESNIYRQWGMDVIGMTNYQEAKLARESEICYATIALVTDYDCWHEEETAVDVEMVIKTLTENVAKAQRTIRALLPTLSGSSECSCQSALNNAIMTDRDLIPDEIKNKLKPIVGKYLG